MQLDLRTVKHQVGACLPFSFALSVADVEPTVPGPVSVQGEVRNRAGYLIVSMSMEAEVHTVCDRCAEPVCRKQTASFEAALVDHIEGEEDDSIIVCENDMFEPDELARATFLLELPSKNLCREDCKGLCPQCGANWNTSTCSCRTGAVDPRLAKLAALLDE